MAHLIVKSGKRLGCLFSFKDELIVGRADETIRQNAQFLGIEDEMVSRRHCKLFFNENGYHVKDLGSTNGTLLANDLLTPNKIYPIHDGMILQVGDTQLLFTNLEVGRSTGMSFDSHATVSFTIPQMDIDSAPEIEIRPDTEMPQDISMFVDATQFIHDMHDQGLVQTEPGHDLVKRMQAMIQVSMALGAITDVKELTAKIMELLFDLFGEAERAFVMLSDRTTEKLVPLSIRYREGHDEVKETIDISETIVNTVINEKQALLLKDAQREQNFGNQESIMAMAVRSVMCAPLLYEDTVLGLVQVDNRTGYKEFTGEDLEVLTAVCSQLAISLKNSQLYQDIEHLFEGFVRASVQAIESRDPATAGHSFRVAEYTESLARAVDMASIPELRDTTFNREQIQELRYAALLHDFGKVGVREHVLTKAKKLYSHELKHLRLRVRYAEACIETLAYRRLVEEHASKNYTHEEFLIKKQAVAQEILKEKTQLHRFLDTVLMMNEPGSKIDNFSNELLSFKEQKFRDVRGIQLPLLEEFEFSALNNARGSLNTDERREIESHVTHTHIFLSLIPWTRQLSNVPDIAHAHHERLDGSGYPRGLNTDEIPVQSKIMAIADVYDALTSGDRPYRRGINSERALEMIEAEVKVGKLDKTMFKIFVESRSFNR
ncbi:MAG: GAF domain-containing protein [Gammaproteobacteria bacterium]|nr:GAF domain-containing protein [Gammaproteobacteria bacterium]